jgi:hypothetical protein
VKDDATGFLCVCERGMWWDFYTVVNEGKEVGFAEVLVGDEDANERGGWWCVVEMSNSVVEGKRSCHQNVQGVWKTMMIHFKRYSMIGANGCLPKVTKVMIKYFMFLPGTAQLLNKTMALECGNTGWMKAPVMKRKKTFCWKLAERIEGMKNLGKLELFAT